MIADEFVSALEALAHPTRIAIVQELSAAGPEGMAAGVLAEAISVSRSNLSPHLQSLSRAGMLSSRRNGKSIIYRVQGDRLALLAEALASLARAAPSTGDEPREAP